MEQQGYFQLFRERWIAPVAGIVLGAGIATVLAFALPPTYSARATLLMSISSPEGTLSDRSQYSLDRVSSYPELAFSDEVLELTIDDLGLDVSAQQLARHISAANPPTTMLIQIVAEADSAELASDIANSVAANLADTVSDLENAARDGRYRTTLDISNPASPPSNPSEPQKSVIIGLGILVGLAVGLIAAILWARLDTGVRSLSQVRRISGLPVLGQLTTIHNEAEPADGATAISLRGDAAPADAETPSVASDKQHRGKASVAAERAQRRETLLRETQLAIKQANAGELPRLLLLIPSGSWDAGREASMLRRERRAFARAVAVTGRSVLLLDDEEAAAPAASGKLPRKIAAPSTGGLTAVLRGSIALRDAVRPLEGERFSVIAEGDPDESVTERLIEQRIETTTAAILSEFDTFVVEATSLTQPVSLEIVAPYTDGAVVLVRYGHTRAAELAHTLSRIRLSGLRPLGVVLTDVPKSRLEDVVASWLPDDFAETPGIARVVPVSATDQPPADVVKAPPRARSARVASGQGQKLATPPKA